MKEFALSDTSWHITEVFVSLESVVETSLRILDSNTPNLKDAAFAYCHIETEMGDPLASSLAKISDWGDIDLNVDLGSEHQGSLQRFAKVSRSPEIARDRPRSPEIARDRPREHSRALEST